MLRVPWCVALKWFGFGFVNGCLLVVYGAVGGLLGLAVVVVACCWFTYFLVWDVTFGLIRVLCVCFGRLCGWLLFWLGFWLFANLFVGACYWIRCLLVVISGLFFDLCTVCWL